MPAPEPIAPPPSPGTFWRHVEEFILIVLVALSAIGVAVNDVSPKSAYRYWLWMAPTFGVISVAAAWWRAQRHTIGGAGGAAVAALGGRGLRCPVYLMQSTGRMQNEAAGLTH